MNREKITEHQDIGSAYEYFPLATIIDAIERLEKKHGILSDIGIKVVHVPERGHGEDREAEYYRFTLQYKRCETDREAGERERAQESQRESELAESKRRNKYKGAKE